MFRRHKNEQKKFKSFEKTFPWILGFLKVGLMYPNPKTDRIRITLIVTLFLLSLPVIGMVCIDVYFCWIRRDLFNIIRHSTIIGPYCAAFFKMFLMYFNRRLTRQLMDVMNEDYARYNQLPRSHQDIVSAYIKESMKFSNLWSRLIFVFIMLFPILALGNTVYSRIFDEFPQRYMLHDLNVPFREPEARFKSPFFEIMFVNMTMCALICVFNYIPYDALFGLTTNHACLKMSLYCKRLEDAFMMDDPEDMYKEVVGFIMDQKKLFEYYELIQNHYHLWLGTILVSTMIQIGSLLFHISAGYGFDVRYSLFSICAVVHIFLPCKNAANLKAMSTETATRIYCSGWEHCNSPQIRRIMPFLIARSQIPLITLAFYLFDYDMELFVNIMRTSYSMFTLLRS